MSHYNVIPEPFDVVLYTPRSWAPWRPGLYIAAWTGCQYVHAGIVLRGRLEGADRMRVLVLDAAAGGVSVRPLSADLRRGDRICLRRPRGVDIGPCETQQLAAFAWEHWGYTGYSIPKLLRQMRHILLGAGAVDAPEPPTSVICSELVSLIWRGMLGVDPWPTRRDSATTPAHLYRSPEAETIAEPLQLIEEAE